MVYRVTGDAVSAVAVACILGAIPAFGKAYFSIARERLMIHAIKLGTAEGVANALKSQQRAEALAAAAHSTDWALSMDPNSQLLKQ